MKLARLYCEFKTLFHLGHCFKIRKLQANRLRDVYLFEICIGLENICVDFITFRFLGSAQAYFECSICGAFETVMVDRGRVTEPLQCNDPHNPHKNAMQIIHNRLIVIFKRDNRHQRRKIGNVFEY